MPVTQSLSHSFRLQFIIKLSEFLAASWVCTQGCRVSAKVGEALGWGDGSSTAGDLKGLGLRSQAGDRLGSGTAECGNTEWEGQAWVKGLQVTPEPRHLWGPCSSCPSLGSGAPGMPGPLGSASSLVLFLS